MDLIEYVVAGFVRLEEYNSYADRGLAIKCIINKSVEKRERESSRSRKYRAYMLAVTCTWKEQQEAPAIGSPAQYQTAMMMMMMIIFPSCKTSRKVKGRAKLAFYIKNTPESRLWVRPGGPDE